MRLERLRELKDRCSRQIVYAITSIPPEVIDAAGLLALVRAHWQIENRLFLVNDGTFAEDAAASRREALRQPWPICAMKASRSAENATRSQNPPARPSPQTQRPQSEPSSGHQLTYPGGQISRHPNPPLRYCIDRMVRLSTVLRDPARVSDYCQPPTATATRNMTDQPSGGNTASDPHASDTGKAVTPVLARPSVPAVVHTIAIIEYLNKRGWEAATLAEISSTLNISKSHTHSILKTLAQHDWVFFDNRRKAYKLEPGLLSYITTLLNYPILEHVRATLSEFVRQSDMPCMLTQPLTDRSFVVVDTFRSRQFMQVFYPTGYRFPETASAQMRALYAWQNQKTINEWLQTWRAIQHTENTVIDKDSVLQEILATRKRGYARSQGEFSPGLTGLARPIFDREGKVSYILTVSFIAADDEVDEEKVTGLMRAATAEIHRLTLASVPPDY